MIRVLLADDHAVMRSGFRMILEAGGDVTVVGEAATGAEAVTLASELHPDVVCMDVQMPDMDGLEATRRIVADPDVTAAVLVVTTFDRDDYVFEALQAGASGFLLKNAGAEELGNAVRVVASGDALLAPEVTRRVIERFAGSPSDASGTPLPTPTGSSAIVPELTEREREVLRLLAQAYSNAEIAAELFIGDATVKTHVSNLLAKLGARDRVAAVVYAHRHGLA
ncbi:response regulator [Microbacterium gorillae]|uniref:response regulator n=1 Tax=Microbacterium gorillae TaxID=1231063 RepID=UPI00059164B5|nr:response regulator transcription factor [Microbacterium gorillae]